MAEISVTLGESFINTGFVVTFFTALVTSAADSGDVPKHRVGAGSRNRLRERQGDDDREAGL